MGIRQIRVEGSRDRNHVGAVFPSRLRTVHLPAPQRTIRTLGNETGVTAASSRARSAPGSSASKKTSSSEFRRQCAEDKEMIRTLRVAKGLPRDPWGGAIRIMPDVYDKV